MPTFATNPVWAPPAIVAPRGNVPLYAPPRNVTSLADCHFYHATDLPGFGHIEGEWDLRAGADKYLGGIELDKKRVLEIGTASGFLCFYMERQGAEVVGCDLCEELGWDYVPFPSVDLKAQMEGFRGHMRKINNSWWLSHQALGSRARVVYQSVYSIPAAIGPVDVATFGSVLLHLQNPFLAMASACRLVRETVVVTDVLASAFERPTNILWRRARTVRRKLRGVFQPAFRTAGGESGLDRPWVLFMPDHRTGSPLDTWWYLSPDAIRRFLGVLGFEDTTVSFHSQPYRGREQRLFTVVGRRTRGTVDDRSANGQAKS